VIRFANLLNEKENKMYGFIIAVFGVSVMATACIFVPAVNTLTIGVIGAIAYFVVGLVIAFVGISKIGN
jgi:hypothetical protein